MTNREKAAAIKQSLCDNQGRRQAEIAKKHRVSRGHVSDIYTGRVYGDVPWPNGWQPTPNKKGGQRKIISDVDPTNAKILELEGDLVHLQEELNREKRRSKAAAKVTALFKSIVDEMDTRIKPFKRLPSAINPARKRAKIQEHAVMHLSDGHHDQVITPDECGGLEEYNFPISCARAERYVNTVIEWTTDTLAPKFNFTDLWVLAYGDHTSGEIHGHTERSYYRNIFRNCEAIGQLHGLMYRDLAPHFEHVHVVYLPGNHGRRSTEKNHLGAHDNWDYLIGKIAELYCRDIENVDFLIPNAFSCNVNINGVGFNLSHGDDVRGTGGVPFFGMAKRQKGLIALGAAQGAPNIRYFCMGHHHCASNLSDINGEMIVNGAWPGTDAYAYNSFAGYREPAQWLHGVNPVHGVTWRLNVKLKHAGEKGGPKRYKIDGGREVGIL